LAGGCLLPSSGRGAGSGGAWRVRRCGSRSLRRSR